MTETRSTGPLQDAEALKKLFDTTLLERRALTSIEELAAARDGETCLCLNGTRVGLALHLCDGAGTWQSAHGDAESARLVSAYFPKRAVHLQGPELPYTDGHFDVVVVHDYLERQADPHKVIAECHRVLKPSGRLVVLVPRAKRWAFARGLQRALGLKSSAELKAVSPYTSARLFDVVKDGFDVEEELSFGRFFLVLAESLADFIAAVTASRAGPETASESVLKARTWCYPFLFVARVLDLFLFFTRGYFLVCRARRRIWRPRRTPVLQDGRSIADATINTKIGTASPFHTNRPLP